MKGLEFITENWAQVAVLMTFLSGAIGYFVKRHYDYLTKKKEIEFTIYAKRKLELVSDFTKYYLELEQVYYKLNISDVKFHTLSVNELDRMITEPLLTFKKSYNMLLLVLTIQEMHYFDLIYENLMSINRFINDVYRQIIDDDEGDIRDDYFLMTRDGRKFNLECYSDIGKTLNLFGR